MEHLIIDLLALAASFTVKLVGFPQQLRAGTGMVRSLSGGMVASYAIWTVQGSFAGDWPLVASSVLGVALTAGLLLQSLRAARRKP